MTNKVRERTVRAHAVREGDEIYYDQKWWIVIGRFVRLPVKYPSCPVCYQQMLLVRVEGEKLDKGVFLCDNANTSCKGTQVDVLVLEVSEDERAFELKRGSRVVGIRLRKIALVKIIRR